VIIVLANPFARGPLTIMSFGFDGGVIDSTRIAAA